MRDKSLIVTFDSGLGGLTVYREIKKQIPDAATLYVADDAAFPYGRLAEDVLVARVMNVLGAVIEKTAPDVIVIACNTASTLVLPHLRERFASVDCVGTVPAVKPAAEQSQSRMITVLGTSGTVQRDYTHSLIRDHAAHCDVTLVGSERLAALAEASVHGLPVSDDEIARELAPCFVENNGRRTDHIVLACTHYPLLLERFAQLTGAKIGWPVTFVDPAAAIARRAAFVLAQRAERNHDKKLTPPDFAPDDQVWTTSGQADGAAQALFAANGLSACHDFCIQVA